MEFQLPNLNKLNEKEISPQLKSYLFQLIEQLQWNLSRCEEEISTLKEQLEKYQKQ